MSDVQATQQGADGEGSLDDVQGLLGGDDGEQEVEDGAVGQFDDGQPESADDPVYTIKVNGADKQVRHSELIANAQKYESATQRFEEAANLRKQAEPEIQAARAERQQLQQVLGTYTQQLTAMLQMGQPDPALINTDPQEYMRQSYAHQQRMSDLQQAQAAQAELTRREQIEQANQQKARSAEEQTKLLDAIPEWKDPAKAKVEAEAVDGYLARLGFSDAERNSLSDHRLVVVARDAMRYQQLMQQKTQATQRVQNVPARVERPGVSTQQPNEAGAKAARDRFAKNPSRDTLADLL